MVMELLMGEKSERVRERERVADEIPLCDGSLSTALRGTVL